MTKRIYGPSLNVTEWEREVLGYCLSDAEDNDETLEQRLRGECHPRMSRREWVRMKQRVARLSAADRTELVESLKRDREARRGA